MKINNERGQSTIEFIFAFIFGVSFILMIFNSAINQATGYLVHYATFMASRVYLTSDSYVGTIGNVNPSLSTGVDRASTAFNNYALSIFKVPNSAFQINPAGSGQPDEYLTVGGRTVFDVSIDVIGKIVGQSKLELVSESFLGKEPTRAECATQVCEAMTKGSSCDNTMDITLYDNGC